MKIERFFTRNISSPYEGIAFETRTSEIKNIDGSVVRRMKKVVVPSFWSQVATDILAQKYFRKAGIPAALKKKKEKGVPLWLQCSVADEEALDCMKPDDRYRGEEDAREVFNRMAGCSPTGAGSAAISTARRTRRIITMKPPICWPIRSRPRIRRSGSTPACTGRMASTDLRRATFTWITTAAR